MIVTNDRPEDPWGDAVPLRDVAAIKAALVGAVVTAPDQAVAFEVSFPDDVRASRAANAYLVELADTFARPLTLRSYAYDILRWLRFLSAVGVAFDEAVRSDYTDFRRWLIEHGKTGGSRRQPRTSSGTARMNPITGKTGPHESQFDPATVRHSRVVLHEWYEFLRDRGLKPIVNPIPHSAVGTAMAIVPTHITTHWNRSAMPVAGASIPPSPRALLVTSPTPSSTPCGRS